MAITSKLCNPTPWDASFPYEPGIRIKIPAFSDTDITMQQMDDFRDGKPGSEAVLELLDYDGLFLMDTDRPYDYQALTALTKAKDKKKAQYDAAVKNLRDRRAAAGMSSDEENFQEIIKMMGYDKLKEKVDVLTQQINEYKKAIGPESEEKIRATLDPTRTVFVMDPPTEFPSVAAMNFFLNRPDNKTIKEEHEAFVAAQEDSEQ